VFFVVTDRRTDRQMRQGALAVPSGALTNDYSNMVRCTSLKLSLSLYRNSNVECSCNGRTL